MRKLTGFLLAVVLVLAILYVAVADVNHGHGPDHGEETQTEVSDAGGH